MGCDIQKAESALVVVKQSCLCSIHDEGCDGRAVDLGCLDDLGVCGGFEQEGQQFGAGAACDRGQDVRHKI
jgi:hypothetical protein